MATRCRGGTLGGAAVSVEIKANSTQSPSPKASLRTGVGEVARQASLRIGEQLTQQNGPCKGARPPRFRSSSPADRPRRPPPTPSLGPPKTSLDVRHRTPRKGALSHTGGGSRRSTPHSQSWGGGSGMLPPLPPVKEGCHNGIGKGGSPSVGNTRWGARPKPCPRRCSRHSV